MAEQAALSFGGLLRQLRAEARLTQEELAEAAQLSPRSVSDLERGIAVVGAGGLQRWDILDNLTALVGKSMVIEEEGPDQTSRYRLLETMRAYARQQLAATGEPDRLKRWHAEHYAALAGRAGPELLGPLQLAWQNRIRTEVDNLQAAVTWALTENGQTRQLAFRIVAALASSALSGRGAVGVWAEACIPQISSCPAETRAAVIAAAAWSAFFAGDLPLAQRRAEDALREPASSDWSSLGMPRGLLSRIYALTGQPERGARRAREGRQEAATRGIEVLAGYFHAMEALAWTVAGDHATARRPAMEAVQTARKVRNPALSAMACFVAAAALWLDKPRTALALIEDSLAPCRVGAMDSVLGFALSLAVAIRTRNGDLPGALALLPEATMQQHNDGNRLGSAARSAAAPLCWQRSAKPNRPRC